MASTSQLVPLPARIVPRTRSWSARVLAEYEAEQSPPQLQEPPSKKRSAVVAAPWQLDILVSLFKQNQNPTEEQRQWVASKTDLEEKWIANWFQRQRNPRKRIQSLAKLTTGVADARALSASRSDTFDDPRATVLSRFEDALQKSNDTCYYKMSPEYPSSPDPFESHRHAGADAGASSLVFSTAINPIHLTTHAYPSFIQTPDIPTPQDTWTTPTFGDFPPPVGQAQEQGPPDISGFLFDRAPYERRLVGLGLSALPTSTSDQFSSNVSACAPQALRISPSQPEPLVFDFSAPLHVPAPPAVPISFPMRLSDLVSLTKRIRSTYAQDMAQAIKGSPDLNESSTSPRTALQTSSHEAVGDQEDYRLATSPNGPFTYIKTEDDGSSTEEEPEVITPQDEVDLVFPVMKRELSAAELSAALTERVLA
ncbi:hypothetical protein OE88DRAFT_1378181 [Heliocybe sulcata]|uniref:Homeobox domain-containing protein n=1 Tax=Heliocybe sulcata TaxID=5364 RepID=A0A5C3N4B1_9AGAM|nr:hypothetical protein OE88DRAFT_1378181 [Heliocybe sulcata]